MDEIIRFLFFSPFVAGGFLLTGFLYAGMIFWFRKGWNNLETFEKECDTPEEKITVIIPCFNEEKNLPPLIMSLEKQNYPSDLTEIILVDDHSTDHTWEIMQKAARDHATYKVFRNKGRGKKEALLTAVEKSSGLLILTTDADARPGPEWISVLVAFRQQTGCGFIAGPVSSPPGKSFLSRFRSLEFYSLVGAGTGAAGTGHPLYCNGANLTYEKKLLENTADPLKNNIRSGDDVFLLHTVKSKHPGTVRFLKSVKATVTVSEKPGFGAFFRQRTRWASKSPGYRDSDTILTALVVFCLNLFITGSFLAGIFQPARFVWTFILLLIKSIPDYLLLREVTSFFGVTQLMKDFPASQLLYPFYLTATALAGLFSFAFRKDQKR